MPLIKETKPNLKKKVYQLRINNTKKNIDI